MRERDRVMGWRNRKQQEDLMKRGRWKEVWLLWGRRILGGTPPWWTALRCGAGPPGPVHPGTVGRTSIPEGVYTPMIWTRGREMRRNEGVVGLVVLPVDLLQ